MVTSQHVRDALDGWIGSDWTPAAEYSALSSLLSARHADAWPWVAASRLGESYELPTYLQPYRRSLISAAGCIGRDIMARPMTGI